MLLTVLRREVDQHNRETGRRSQGARGRSYEQVFRDGLQDRIVRKPAARQLYLAGLVWQPVAVDRNGQVCRDGWVYGGPVTQDALLRFHGTGQRILLGRDPDDLSAPAIAYDEAGHLICEGIEPVKRGAYDSFDGIRDGARNRKAARKQVDAAEAANDYLDADIVARALAALDVPGDAPAAPPAAVRAGHFGSPLKPRKRAMAEDEAHDPLRQRGHLKDEYLKNYDAMLDAKIASIRPGG